MSHNGRNGTNVPGPRTREERGRAIADRGGIILPENARTFEDLAALLRFHHCGVPSQSSARVWYGVTRWGCTCPDWRRRSADWRAGRGPQPEPCKHMWAVAYAASDLPRDRGYREPDWDGACPRCGGGTVCRPDPNAGNDSPTRLVDRCLCGWSQPARPRPPGGRPRSKGICREEAGAPFLGPGPSREEQAVSPSVSVR